MTLNDRIKQDLTELYLNGEITTAHDLSVNMFGVSDAFAAHGMPGHFCGNRQARTVMVMLNPGKDVSKANNPICTHAYLSKLSIDTSSVANFIDTYKKGSKDYGHIDKHRLDNFDIKQAAFLKHWENCGVDIAKEFPMNTEDAIRESVKENVLTQKLQLELVPYASRSFETIKDKCILELLFPFVETLFDEIFSCKREYVIFCSDYFDTLFREYDKNNNIRFDKKQGIALFSKGRKAYCTPIKICYGSDSIKAVIAHTFPNQALPNAYAKMEQYGKFCYGVFKGSAI